MSKDVARVWRAVAPALVLALFGAVSTAGGGDFSILALVVIAPLLAATLLGIRGTSAYAVAAVAETFALGMVLNPDLDPVGQAVRVLGVALGGVLSVIACKSRLGRERQLIMLGVRAARSSEQAKESARMAGLVSVAHALGDTATLHEILEVLNSSGIGAVEAQAVVLALRVEDEFAVIAPEWYSEDVRTEISRLPLHHPLPVIHSGRTGDPLFLPDAATAESLFPGCIELFRASKTEAVANLPLRLGERVLGAMSVSWSEPREITSSDQRVLAALASQCAQALERLSAIERERVATENVRAMAETLQMSLLTGPEPPEHLEIAVRYAAAVDQADVGGDWYDVFVTLDGTTNLVIGDCAGHDTSAAAAMASMRNMLRGTAYALRASPAGTLEALEHAIEGVELDSLATAIVIQIEPPGRPGGVPGHRRVRWSNAGHPPLIMRQPNGTTTVLRQQPDLLLGLVPETRRHDQVVDVPRGSVLLMYTDGLVERRGEDLDIGVERVRSALSAVGGASLDEVCRVLLRGTENNEDDTAILAVRVL